MTEEEKGAHMGDERHEDDLPEEFGEEDGLQTLGREESRQALYALLFVSDRPMSPARLAEALGDADPEVVQMLL